MEDILVFVWLLLSNLCYLIRVDVASTSQCVKKNVTVVYFQFKYSFKLGKQTDGNIQMQNISLTAPQGNPVFSLAENPLKKDQELAIFWINLDQWIVHYSQSPMPINLPSKAWMWETIISWQIHTQVDLMIFTSAARITRTQDG